MPEIKRQFRTRLLSLGYAQVLRMVVDGPVSWVEVAEALRLDRVTAQRVLRGFVRQRVAHVTHWLEALHNKGAPRPYISIGDMPSAMRPRRLSCKPAPTPPELLAFCDLVAALQKRSWTKGPLALHLGQSDKTVRRVIDLMHKLRLVHIEDYQHRKTGAGSPLYAWGPDESDAVKPRPQGAQKLAARWSRIRTERDKQLRMQAALAGKAKPAKVPGGRRRLLSAAVSLPAAVFVGDVGASSATPLSSVPQLQLQKDVSL